MNDDMSESQGRAPSTCVSLHFTLKSGWRGKDMQLHCRNRNRWGNSHSVMLLL